MGGTSLIFTSTAIGMILSVSRSIAQEDSNNEQKNNTENNIQPEEINQLQDESTN